MKPEEILDRLNRLTPFSAAKTSALFAVASDLRQVVHRNMAPEIRELVGSVGEELATRSSGHLKALGVLADIADGPRIRRILLSRANWVAADAHCAAAWFRLSNRPRSQAWAHSLAAAAGSDFANLDAEIVSDLKARILGDVDVEHDFEPSWAAPKRDDLVWPASPVVIDGVPGVRVRPLASSNQIDRASNYLKNCLSSLYKIAILKGQKRIATVEVDGQPVEALEIDLRTGRVLQWKGVANSAPDAKRRRVIEKHLVALNIVASRPE
jgi:hypothetical protein